jgi:hypothetical protein
MKLNVVTGLISIVMTKTGPDSVKRRAKTEKSDTLSLYDKHL